MIAKSVEILEELQHPNGLFSASSKEVKTGYKLCWVRDTVYASLGFEVMKINPVVRKTYRAILDIMLKHEYKIDWMIKQPSKDAFRYIHARYNPETMEEIEEEWGNKQNDSIGAVLFKVGDLEGKGIRILRNADDCRILQKLVNYLEAIEYWHDKDNGMWEENEEIHASSVGACVAGLKSIKKINGIAVSTELISKGEKTLNKILPRESKTKEVDLALLSLIYPYNIVSDKQRSLILKSVEEKLVREKGIIRYIGDKYYNNGEEAQWCFGFPWLAIINRNINQHDKYAYYIKKIAEIVNNKGEMPELYYGNTSKYNENTPLGWAQSMSIVALA